MRLDRAAKGLFLLEFVTGFVLGMRYFFRPKATINYPYEKNPISPRFRGAVDLARDVLCLTTAAFRRGLGSQPNRRMKPTACRESGRLI